MTQCAKIIVGFVANVGNVFYPTFTNVFFIFCTFLRFLTFFFNFHLNVYYIYDIKRDRLESFYISLESPLYRLRRKV